MDILQYIDRIKRNYGNEPVPVRYNTQKYLQGGRVKYQGAGLVDHGPEGVRQGYAEKRIGIKDEKGLFTGRPQVFSDAQILEEANKLEIDTKGWSPDDLRKEVKRVKAAITRQKKMLSELTKDFKEFYKTENFNVNEDGKFVQKQHKNKVSPKIAAKKFGVTPAVYSEMGTAYMKDLTEKGHLVGADKRAVDIKRKESKIKGEAEAGEKAVKQNKIMKDAIRAENKKLITSLDKNPKATIAAIRNNPNLMEQLTSFWNKKTGKIEKIEKYKNGISDADIKRYIKSGLYSEEHISPLSKGAKNVEFPKNKAWVTKQGNTKILQQMSDWLNTGKNFNLNDSKVVDAKKWLTKHSLSTKVQNWKGFWGDDSLKKLSAVEAQAAQFNKIKIDYPKTSLAKKALKAAKYIGKTGTKIAGTVLPVLAPAAVGLGLYDMERARAEGMDSPLELGTAYYLGPEVARGYGDIKKRHEYWQDPPEDRIKPNIYRGIASLKNDLK